MPSTLPKAAVALACLAFTVHVTAAIRGPGTYNGVVICDRWGSCHLYSGVYLMEISEKVREFILPIQRQAVLIDAQEVFQPINPGDGLITKLQVLGPAEEPDAVHEPALAGLRLRAIPRFQPQQPDEFIIELRNGGDRPVPIDTNALAPTIFAKRPRFGCLSPADGVSYAVVTRTDVEFLSHNPARGSCPVYPSGEAATLSLAPGPAVPPRFDLSSEETIEVHLRFNLLSGEYEFLAGYGGGVHAARSLVSNQIQFDVDVAGKTHIVP